jgi:hypothetical protein
MNLGKFRYLSDEELVRMLDGSDLTDKEKMLLERLEKYVSQESIEEVEERFHKSYESIDEQSEFRRQLIEEIYELSNEWPKKYKNAIYRLITESYVEL